MNRIITIAALLFLGQASQAQSPNESAPVRKPVKVSLSDHAATGHNKGPVTAPSTTALWDIQDYFAIDTVTTNNGGFAGVAWVGNEWWVSQWAKDSLFTIDASGNLISGFKIAGVGTLTSGARSMTYDGTNLYIADNTPTIKIVNPATKTLTGTIDVSAVGFNARAITYAQAINGGAGGFYIGNFGNDIAEVSLTGTVLNTISASTHTLTAIYGLAYDDLSAGGPFLWAFDQGTQNPAADAKLYRLSLPTGAPTTVIHNVNTDIGALSNTGIAGGVFITDSYAPGELTIAGVIQGTLDILFAYELDSSSTVMYDGAVSRVNFTPMNTLVPDEHMATTTFPLEVENLTPLYPVTINATVTVSQGGSPVGTYTGSASNVPSATVATISTTGSLTPTGITDYDVQAVISLVGQSDADASNDSSNFTISVTDTTFALDNGQITGSLGIGGGTGGTLGQIFTLNVNDVITTVTAAFNGPTSGDSTRIVVYDFTGTPNLMVGESDYYVFSDDDTNGVVLDLPVRNMSGNPLNLTAGTYYFGVEEYAANVTLATSDFNWRPAITWVTFGTTPWSPNENFGFERIYVLRPNTGNSITSLLETPAIKTIEMYPNPTTSEVNFKLEKGVVTFDVMDIRGAVLRHAQFDVPTRNGQVSLAGLPAGVYQVRARDINGMSYVSRLVKQ